MDSDLFTAKTSRALDWFRCCHFCGSWMPPIDYVCDVCWSERFHLSDQRALPHFWRDGLIIHSLFNWKDSRLYALGLGDVDSQDLAQLLRALKGGRLQTATRRLARQFWLRLVAFEEISRFKADSTLLVPAPSRSGRMDHGSAWAWALAQESGLSVNNCLRHAGESDAQSLIGRAQQKSRSQRERRLIQFQCDEQKHKRPPSTRIIFVDDVVTTGSTVWAAYEALGKPDHFEIWSIACRAF